MAAIHLHIERDPLSKATHIYHTVEVPDGDPLSQARALLAQAEEYLNNVERNFGVRSGHAAHARELESAAKAALECFGEEVDA